jgi:hypothetical protein
MFGLNTDNNKFQFEDAVEGKIISGMKQSKFYPTAIVKAIDIAGLYYPVTLLCLKQT